jgi:L-aminopeptidase/D-esterase-like protein
MRVETVDSIVLTGGSAFGLAAADGVVRALESDGVGHETMVGPVPIVPAAVIFDLWLGDPTARPGPIDGEAAYRAATDDPVEMGSVGAGTGAVVAGWRGPTAIRKGGIGSVAVQVGDATVGALVVLNAVGDVFTVDGEALTGGPTIPSPTPIGPALDENTTLAIVATDAAIDRSALTRVCVQAHDAFAACLRPSHTRYDGDAVFAVSCGDRDEDLDAIGVAAFEAVARSIEVAMRAATSMGGVAAMEDR